MARKRSSKKGRRKSSKRPGLGNIVMLDMLDRRNKIKFMVLSGPCWTRALIGTLSGGLFTEVYSLGSRPEDIIINGEYSRAKIVSILGRGIEFDHKVIVGLYSKDLPFKPPI